MVFSPRNDAEWIAVQNLLGNLKQSNKTVKNDDIFSEWLHKSIPEWMDDGSVDSRNCMQWYPQCHPLTCGNNRKDEAHIAYQKRFGGDFGQLIAVEDGEIQWRCPVCDYEQK